MERVEIITDPTIEQSGGNEVTARIEIELRDGRKLKRRATLEKGSDQKWISEAELREKFSAAASGTISKKRITALWQIFPKLDQLKNIAPLLNLIREKK